MIITFVRSCQRVLFTESKDLKKKKKMLKNNTQRHTIQNVHNYEIPVFIQRMDCDRRVTNSTLTSSTHTMLH